MATKSRHDYYLSADGTLLRRMSVRPSGRGPWPPKLRTYPWVLSLEISDSSPKIVPGPEITKARIAEAMLIEYGRPQVSTVPDLGKVIPDWLFLRIANQVERQIINTERYFSRDWDAYASEMSLVALLVQTLNRISFEEDGWSVSMRGQEFSAIVKEPKTGADIGLLIEVMRGDERTTKALWFQAKRSLHMPSIAALHAIPDFDVQCDLMRKYNSESYGLLLTRSQIMAYDQDRLIKFSKIVSDGISCSRGNQDSEILANTLSARYLVAVEVDAPE